LVRTITRSPSWPGVKRRCAVRGVPQAQIDAFMTEATAGDYDHLLQTCMQRFEVE
jgi:hypothetical protein